MEPRTQPHGLEPVSSAIITHPTDTAVSSWGVNYFPQNQESGDRSERRNLVNNYSIFYSPGPAGEMNMSLLSSLSCKQKTLNLG